MQWDMAQDLAHKRPYLFGSLIAGISFPATWLFLPIDGGLYAMLWKMAAVGLLVPFALRRHHEGEFILLAIMLAFYTLGDGLIELSMVAGALAFAATPVIAYGLPPTQDEGIQMAAYSVILAAMAAMAWNSNFPRCRVGLGAILFVVSDLLIFAELGPLAGSTMTGIAIWYLYYFGVLMIAVGVAQTLVKRGHFADGEERD
jgi:uncharacterized membrane protein YhhN